MRYKTRPDRTIRVLRANQTDTRDQGKAGKVEAKPTTIRDGALCASLARRRPLPGVHVHPINRVIYSGS